MLWLLALVTLVGADDVHVAIAELLPKAPAVARVPVPEDATAAQRARALKKHPSHGEHFWVREISGEPAARRVVFLIPQYHRNTAVPIAWTTLGREIADVQGNIDVLVRVLASSQGLTCIGTEGTSRKTISYSGELRQLALWKQELPRARDAALAGLRRDAQRARAAIDATVKILERAIDLQAVYVDGVGAAQSRLAGAVRWERFGLEHEGTHTDAVALLEQLKEVEEQLARVDPGTEPEEAGIVGQMWLDEYPDYEKSTIAPLAEAVSSLNEMRLELRSEGAEEASWVLATWIARVRRMAGETIRPDEVEATIAYYRDLERRRAEGVKETGRELTRAEKKRRKELLARQAEIHARYQAITRERREQVAAEMVIERMREHRRCALVMGAGHEEGLTQQLRAVAERAGIGPIGIITVAPFNFE